MLTEYLPIVVMGGLAAIFAVGSLLASSLLRPNRPNPVKSSAYECGNDPVRLPRGERFSVKFYVVAMLFIIFDIETIFLFPWAVSFRRQGGFDWAHQDVTPNEPEDVVARERAQEEERARALEEAAHAR